MSQSTQTFSWINPLNPFVLSSDCMWLLFCEAQLPSQVWLLKFQTKRSPVPGSNGTLLPAAARKGALCWSSCYLHVLNSEYCCEGMGRYYGAYIENTEICECIIVYLRPHEKYANNPLLFPTWNSIVFQIRGCVNFDPEHLAGAQAPLLAIHVARKLVAWVAGEGWHGVLVRHGILPTVAESQ